jgi:trigger factor
MSRVGENRENHEHDHEHGPGHDHDHGHDHDDTGVAIAPKVEIHDVGPWKKTLKIEVSAEDVKSEYEESLKELSRTVQIPGFRKGHVPRARLLKQFAKPLSEEVKAKLVGKASEAALTANTLEAIAMPEVNVDEIAFELEKPLAFEITVEVKPTFELPSYTGLKLTRRTVSVSEERVDGFIGSLRRNEADYVAVEDGAKPGDRLTVDARLLVDGEEKWKTENDVAHLLDDMLLGLPIPAKRVDVEGIATGDERSLEVTVPQSFKDEALRGKTGTLVLKVLDVKRPELPPLDDEAAKKLGAESAADLRERVRARLEQQAKSDQDEDLSTQVIDHLVKNAAFDLPEGLLQRETESRQMRQMIRMSQMGVSPDSLEERQRQELRDGAKSSSDRNLRASLIFAKIAEAEKIEVTDEEVEEEIFRLATAYGRTPVAIRSQLERENRIEPLREGLATGKVVNFLVGQADITDAVGEPAALDGKVS